MKSKILQSIPFEQLSELARILLQSGVPKAAVIDELVAFADGAVDWRQVVKGLGGELLEAADGPIARAVITVVVMLAGRGLQPKAA